VPASGDRLDWLEYFETPFSRQVVVGKALVIMKNLVLLRRFDIVDDVNQHSNRATFPPLSHILLLSIVLLFSVAVGVFVGAKYNSLADEVERVTTAAEAPVSGLIDVLARERGDRSVVVGSVVEYKVA
jgi:uncharacterized protein involved in cysteine biosynthesis